MLADFASFKHDLTSCELTFYIKTYNKITKNATLFKEKVHAPMITHSASKNQENR